MNMVGGCHIIQDAKPETFLGFKQPMQPPFLVFGKFQQKFSFMTSMGDVPYVSGDVMSVRSWHFTGILFLKTVFFLSKKWF